jgi:DNA-directed RNA polymerase subunit RPC12/RpoP
MPFYAVCTRCAFLRAYRAGSEAGTPASCPACGAELLVEERPGRFAPTYVARVSRMLHSAEPLAATPRTSSGVQEQVRARMRLGRSEGRPAR